MDGKPVVAAAPAATPAATAPMTVPMADDKMKTKTGDGGKIKTKTKKG